MHELSIAENIVEIVSENLNSSDSVRKIKLRIGEMATVIPDSLEFCFGAITKGTALENAELEIEQTKIVVRCEGCACDSEVENLQFRCKKCGSIDVAVVSGIELQVVEIELEDRVGA
jgi:hydrogenase nickel incorporation protein HypA/HybF